MDGVRTMIERAWFSDLRNAVGARHDHERVLELAPSTVEAKLIVGAHNYVVGSLPWGVKAAASMVGLGGNKDKGLQYLKECAQGEGETSVDAQILLVLFLRREHRYDEALSLARTLISRYPQNALLALEEGNLLRAAGRNQEAATASRLSAIALSGTTSERKVTSRSRKASTSTKPIT